MGWNRKPRTTKTQSLSFSVEIFDVLEKARATARVGGRPQPRSEYVQESLIQRWEREGAWPPKKEKGSRR